MNIRRRAMPGLLLALNALCAPIHARARSAPPLPILVPEYPAGTTLAEIRQRFYVRVVVSVLARMGYESKLYSLPVRRTFAEMAAGKHALMIGAHGIFAPTVRDQFDFVPISQPRVFLWRHREGDTQASSLRHIGDLDGKRLTSLTRPPLPLSANEDVGFIDSFSIYAMLSQLATGRADYGILSERAPMRDQAAFARASDEFGGVFERVEPPIDAKLTGLLFDRRTSGMAALAVKFDQAFKAYRLEPAFAELEAEHPDLVQPFHSDSLTSRYLPKQADGVDDKR